MADWFTAAASVGTFLIVASVALSVHRVVSRVRATLDTIRRFVNDR